MVQQAKARTARAEAEAARIGGCYFYAAPRLALPSEDAVLSAELAFLPAGRFVAQRGPHGFSTGQSQRRSRRGRACLPW
jgi:hypothetical protein